MDILERKGAIVDGWVWCRDEADDGDDERDDGDGRREGTRDVLESREGVVHFDEVGDGGSMSFGGGA